MRIIVLEDLWKESQGQPSGMVSSILQERDPTHQAAAEESMQKKVKQRLWLPNKRQRKATEPTTVSRDEQLRLEAAAVGVDLFWPWAPFAHGRSHDVPASMAASREADQTKALSTAFEAKLMQGAAKVWRQLKAWFQEQLVTIPEQMWPSAFAKGFLQHVNEKSGGATMLATYYKLKWSVCKVRAPLDIEDVQPPVATAQGKSLAHQGPALEPAMVWELSDDFNKRLKIRDKAFVQNSVAVVSAFTPIRYSHVSRLVPRWRNEHAAVLWAYRNMVIHQAMMEQGQIGRAHV